MDKILQIKEVRNLTGLGLKESKDLVETWLNGEMPEQAELMAMVAEKVKNRIPRSEEYRIFIRNKVASIKNLIDYIEWEEDFTGEDMPGIREAMENIVEAALTIKERLTYKLEEILSEEEAIK